MKMHQEWYAQQQPPAPEPLNPPPEPLLPPTEPLIPPAEPLANPTEKSIKDFAVQKTVWPLSCCHRQSQDVSGSIATSAIKPMNSRPPKLARPVNINYA